MSPTTTLVRNQWYVAAYSEEIGEELFARTVCNEPLVFFRAEDGAVVGLADRCIHRRYPLSKSQRVEGDRIVCGYHGFTYDRTGTCVAVPAQTRIPRSARVAAYPVVEQDSLVWVWIGDREPSAPESIPRAPWLIASGWTTTRGLETIQGRHALLMDNLMDLSHETYLHGGYIGTPEVADTPITTEIDEEAGVVRVSRRMDDAECPPFYANSTGITGRITRWQDIEFTPPCLYRLHSRVAPQGNYPPPDYVPGRDYSVDDGAFHTEIVYALTPETEHSVHDFWMVARDFAIEDQSITEYLHTNNRVVVMQDVEALNVVEAVIAEEERTSGTYQELSINIDTGALGARRLMANLLKTAELTEPSGGVEAR
ncbi:aromatic ring-hydroxylating dioxygenase subunit alpha [Nocardia sp. CA2R105]|uniref:aromatic ring-hydroxylating dioxygenase subunit alpha n=1 Tax=Nocardia coffeae TaxID=2873381 RepID=UPI001CA76326|nr:aromatic ring-hydroxylating dioxygenase subunit alpha [Nocardia coffeae]MBY8860078.1 aromatic ring-hydroxylating dioxygenase subunit alpha [Nocardia coffeae]